MTVRATPAKNKDALLAEAVMQGARLHMQGVWDEAEAIYKAVLKAQPNHFDAKQLMGDLRFRQGRFDEAQKWLRQALVLNGSGAQVHLTLGKTLAALKRPEDALKSFDKALSLVPDLTDAHYQRALTLNALGRSSEALTAFEAALEIRPDLFEALNGRGVALRGIGRLDEALAAFKAAEAIKPDYTEAISNRGNVLQDLNRLSEAMACYDQALAIDPHFVDAHHNRGRLALLRGDFSLGWEGYEYRSKVDKTSDWKLNAAVPTWNGEDIAGKAVLVFDEQGAGDIIQFSRYLPLLKARGATVTFLVRKSIAKLLSPLLSGIRVINEPDRTPYAFQIALLSLPKQFQTTLSTIPATQAYLKPEAPLVDAWRAKLGAEGYKIGIAWQGNPSGRIDAGRSIPLRFFAPLAARSGMRLISLQKGHGLDQLADLPPGTRVETLGPTFDAGSDAFIDTAAVMANLDLIITSDTSIAHLAGALGRPVWVALKHVPDWRWMVDRQDCPWYPAMRLYRQTARDDWAGVFAQIAADLDHVRT